MTSLTPSPYIESSDEDDDDEEEDSGDPDW